MSDLIHQPGPGVSLTERRWSLSPMPSKVGKFRAILGVAAAALLSACSPLTAFNTITPKDYAVRVAHDVPYG
ncbi:MAG: hypothetical protein EON96_08980, partial [Caulobacteraceae bacterium]